MLNWEQRFGFSQQLKAKNDWKPDMHIHTQYPYGSNVLQHIDQIMFRIKLSLTIRGNNKIQVAANATVCSHLQKVAILVFQFKPI